MALYYPIYSALQPLAQLTSELKARRLPNEPMLVYYWTHLITDCVASLRQLLLLFRCVDGVSADIAFSPALAALYSVIS